MYVSNNLTEKDTVWARLQLHLQQLFYFSTVHQHLARRLPERFP